MCSSDLVLLALAAGALAQPFPSRPVRWIAPFPPGGPTDTLSRILAVALTEAWGVQVVVDNRGGAAGMLGSAIVAKAPPDGYTVLLATQSTHGSNAAMYPHIPYDTVKDFQALTLIGTSCLGLAVHPAVPAKSVGELVQWLRTQGDKVNYASGGTGSSHHISGELLNQRGGTRAGHIPFKGSAPAVQELVSGRISFMFDNLPSSLPMAATGRTRVIAQTCATRSAAAPDIPTMKESGFDNFVVEGWYGMLAPAGTPRPVVQKLSADIARAIRRPDVMERWRVLGIDPVASDADTFAQRIRADLKLWADMVKATGEIGRAHV